MGQSSDELPGGAHLEPAVRMVLFVIFEPSVDLPKCVLASGKGVGTNIIPFERLHKRVPGEILLSLQIALIS